MLKMLKHPETKESIKRFNLRELQSIYAELTGSETQDTIVRRVRSKVWKELQIRYAGGEMENKEVEAEESDEMPFLENGVQPLSPTEVAEAGVALKAKEKLNAQGDQLSPKRFNNAVEALLELGDDLDSYAHVEIAGGHICPRCEKNGVTTRANTPEEVQKLFGFRRMKSGPRPQSYCRKCRSAHTRERAVEKTQRPRKAKKADAKPRKAKKVMPVETADLVDGTPTELVGQTTITTALDEGGFEKPTTDVDDFIAVEA